MPQDVVVTHARAAVDFDLDAPDGFVIIVRCVCGHAARATVGDMRASDIMELASAIQQLHDEHANDV